MLFLDLFLMAAFHLVGHIIFGVFEAHTSILRKLFKVAFLLGVTALISSTVGHPWSLIWIGGMFALGGTFHLWWTLRHGIHPLTAEPRAKYYALRGWE
jgi:hypothetical protein